MFLHPTFRLRVTIALLTCGWLCPSADAFLVHWTGIVDSFWNETDNWNLGFVPRDQDTVVMSTPANDVVLLSGHTAPINGLAVSNGINLHTSGYLLSVDSFGGAETTLWGLVDLFVTPRSDDPANLALHMDKLSVEASSRVFMVGGHGQVDGWLQVKGNSLLKIQDGAQFSAGSLSLGADLNSPGGGGTITVTGTGSRLDLNGTHTIGTHGSALIEFLSGAEGSIVGDLSLGPPGLFNTDGGTIRVFSGTTITTDSIGVGTGGGSYGIITVSGLNSAIEQQGPATLYVGAAAGTGPGTVFVRNRGVFYSGTGLVTIRETGLINLYTSAGFGGTLNTGGDILIDGGELRKSAESTLTMADASTLTIQNGGLADIDGALHIQNSQSVDVKNGGTLDVTSTGGPDGLTIGDGTLHVFAGGQVNLFGGATLTNNGGTVAGGGTIDLGGTSLVNNGGTVAPGDSVGALVLVNGDFTQDSAGTLRIEIGGFPPRVADLLFVDGDATLAGTLDIDLLPFTPSLGDSFQILIANNLFGTFDSVLFPTIPGIGLGVLYDATTVTLWAGLAGDLNADGFVGIADLNIVLGAWNQDVDAGVWLLADPSGDGFVGIEDLNTVLGNWNAGTPPMVDASGTVPEPGTFGLIGVLVSVGTLRRTGRRTVRVRSPRLCEDEPSLEFLDRAKGQRTGIYRLRAPNPLKPPGRVYVLQ